MISKKICVKLVEIGFIEVGTQFRPLYFIKRQIKLGQHYFNIVKHNIKKMKIHVL